MLVGTAGLPGDDCGRRAKRIGVHALRLPDADGGDAARSELLVDVDDARVTELAAQLAVGGQLRQEPVKARVE